MFAHWYLVWNKEPLKTNVKILYIYLLLLFFVCIFLNVFFDNQRQSFITGTSCHIHSSYGIWNLFKQ